MPIKLGKPKQQEETTLEDFKKNPIWVNTFEEEGDFDEETNWPVLAKPANVTKALLNRYGMASILFKIEGREVYGVGLIDESMDSMYSIAAWNGRKWCEVREIKGLKAPLTLVAIPKVLGKANARFLMEDLANDVAKPIA